MCADLWRPPDEASATDNAAALTEWLRAGGSDAAPDALRAAVVAGEARVLDHVARFCGLDAAAPQVWLRRYRGGRPAVTRGGRNWTFDALASSDAAWRAAGGIDAPAGALLHAIAACLLIDEVRPDDVVPWQGAADDPRGWAPLALGAGIRLPEEAT